MKFKTEFYSCFNFQTTKAAGNPVLIFTTAAASLDSGKHELTSDCQGRCDYPQVFHDHQLLQSMSPAEN